MSNRKAYQGIGLNLLGLLLLSGALWAQPPGSWTHFRGSALDGISREKGFPTTWNDSLNIAWKIPEWGKGWSSPVVLENQVWFTTADSKNREMRAICVDLESGEELHNVLLFQPEKLFRIHAVNSYATPTPAIEASMTAIPLVVPSIGATNASPEGRFPHLPGLS